MYIEGKDSAREGQWRSSRTGLYLPYTNWNSGEPNDLGGEDCATLYGDGSAAGRWNDIDCGTHYNSVCEITNGKSTVISFCRRPGGYIIGFSQTRRSSVQNYVMYSWVSTDKSTNGVGFKQHPVYDTSVSSISEKCDDTCLAFNWPAIRLLVILHVSAK